MSDRDVLLEAISLLCNASVTSLQGSKLVAGSSSNFAINGFISALMGRSPLRSALREMVIDEEEFFDPKFDFDFTDLKDTEKYYRGGEVYERPCGWKRYALKVLDKYPDGNAWLGERGFCTTTDSKAGEWPVSYHGTSKIGAQGIIISQFKAGPGQVYGRGIYSTPYISEALPYTKSFISVSTGKNYQVVLQNRVNPQYREKHNNSLYWLVPIRDGLSERQEEEIVEKAIRPYALLLKQL
ncbi:uncharacterized protein LOC118109521 isoform X1 [Hippoglossus stenolepis]|uniref:uncharacterized protein LOC118109521 isoform X1 n=2 Tax=Hippoglossus stenolepis TaxID=195615 RepID=UPI00159C87D8|nr:uncharacterized protein LOC118109521 isoform X1 [Hippoglossus stenolepis]